MGEIEEITRVLIQAEQLSCPRLTHTDHGVMKGISSGCAQKTIGTCTETTNQTAHQYGFGQIYVNYQSTSTRRIQIGAR